MLDPNAKRSYQTAEEAVRLIDAANSRGQSVEVTKDGDIAIEQPRNFLVLWFRKLVGSNRKSPKDILANKMKIDLGSARSHTSAQLRGYFNMIEDVRASGSLKDMCTGWVAIKNQIQSFRNDTEDARQFQQAQQKQTPYRESIDGDYQNRKANTGSVSEGFDDAGSEIASDAEGFDDAGSEAESANHESERISTPMDEDRSLPPATPIESMSVEISAARHQAWINEVNEALPPSMIFSGNTNEIISAKYTIPDHEYPSLFATLENTQLGYALPSLSPSDDINDDDSFDDSFDITTRVASQTLADCGRMAFHLIDQDGFSLFYESGATSEETLQGITSFGKDLPGLSLETCSRLINQEAIGTFDTPLRARIENRTGNLFLFARTINAEPKVINAEGKEDHPNLASTTFTWKKLPDGSGEFEVLDRQKIHFLVAANGKQIPVNRGEQWEGNLNENNFGTEIRFKFRVSASDLKNGNLKNVTIIEPYTVSFRIEPASPDTD